MDRNEIERTVTDYIEGWYDKNPERISAGLHCRLVKRSPDSTAEYGVRDVDLNTLMHVTELYGGTETGDRRKDITIFCVEDTIASVMAVSDSFTDYLHLIHISGKWVIINALWEYNSARTDVPAKKSTEGISIPLHDYIEGWYDKNESRVSRGLHPLLAKRNPADDNTSIEEYTKQSLLEVVPLYGGAKGSDRIIDITVQDAGSEIAAVKAVSNSFIDYIHLVKSESRWMILNVLWKFK